jgi:DNA ligase-1
MVKKTKAAISAATLSLALTSFHQEAKKAELPFELLLAKSFETGLIKNWQAWFLSEKLDGIRAIWTGKALITRQGTPLYPPPFFVKHLPSYPVEGELWAGRGQFNQVMKTVLDKTPDFKAWGRIQFMLFDLPQSIDPFQSRYNTLKKLVSDINQPHIALVKQTQLKDEADFNQRVNLIVEQGGEGAMLRLGEALYVKGRDAHLLKYKKAQDAEAIVIGHLTGKGKYQGMLGALLVALPDGKTFKIGTGFTDAQRAAPPELGEWVTFAYNGFTVNGIPKFARFIRVDKSKQVK